MSDVLRVDDSDGEISDAARTIDHTEAERSDVAASTPAGLCVGATVKKKFRGFGAQFWSGEVTAVDEAAGTFDTLWEDGEELVFEFGEARAMLDAADAEPPSSNAETSLVDGLEIVAREAPQSPRHSASRDDVAPKPKATRPPRKLPKAPLPGRRGGGQALPLFLGPRTVESARAAMIGYVDGVYGASHGGARCPPDLYAGWSVVLTRMASEPLRWVDGDGRVWRTRNDAARAMGLVPKLGPPERRNMDQKWAKTPFGDQRGLLREGSAAAAAGGSDLPPPPRPGDLSPPAALAAPSPPAAAFSLSKAPESRSGVRYIPNNVEEARKIVVEFLDKTYGAAHDGAPCPPALYSGWSVVLTDSASEPIGFLDGAGFVYRTRKDAARAMGILAGPLSGNRACRQKRSPTANASKYAKIPYGDRRVLLFEPGGLGLPASPAAPAAAAAPSPAAAAPSPAVAAPASPPPASSPPASPPPAALPESDDGLEGGVDVVDSLEIVAEEAPSHVRQSFALADAQASTVAELEETIAARDETIAAHEETIAARDETIAARDETIARLKRRLRDYEQPAAPARPPVSRPAAEAQRKSRPVKPGKQQRGTAARRPPPPPPPAEPEVIDLTSDDERGASRKKPRKE